MKVVVFGSTGYLGLPLTLFLKSMQLEVYSPNRNTVDCESIKVIQKYLSQVQPDVVISSIGKPFNSQVSLHEAEIFSNENYLIESNLIDACHKLKIFQFINISSLSIYDNKFQNESYKIKDLIMPQSKYAQKKVKNCEAT